MFQSVQIKEEEHIKSERQYNGMIPDIGEIGVTMV